MTADSSVDEGLLSLRDMKLWLKIEARAARLAATLRIREAKSLVEEYASGRLSMEEANLRLQQHEDKWGLGAKDETTGWQLRDDAADSVHRSRLNRLGVDNKTRSR